MQVKLRTGNVNANFPYKNSWKITWELAWTNEVLSLAFASFHPSHLSDEAGSCIPVSKFIYYHWFSWTQSDLRRIESASYKEYFLSTYSHSVVKLALNMLSRILPKQVRINRLWEKHHRQKLLYDLHKRHCPF